MNFKLLITSFVLAFVFTGLQAQAVDHLINFDKMTHDFGTLDQGAKTEAVFKFTNVSKEPVKLSNVKASCGCTTPTWPREAVAPGETGEIHVKYNSNRIGSYNKSIRITYNDRTDPLMLFIKGKINAKESNKPKTAVVNPVLPPKPTINYGVPRGALSFEKMIENMRQISSEEDKTLEFRFKNTSAKAVTLLTEKTESDPEVSLVPAVKTLQPGQESILKVIISGKEMKKQNSPDGYFSKKIVFFTDEADGGRKQLSVNGNFKRIYSETEKSSAAKIEFGVTSVNGGKIIEGEKFVFDYEFKNTGKSPLILQSVKASCGCTTPFWPKEKEILPGQSEKITVSFNSKGRIGIQSKSVTVKSNAIQNPTTLLKFTVEVVKDPFHAGGMMGGTK